MYIYLDFADSEVAAAQITTPNAILLTKSARLYIIFNPSALPPPV